MDVYIKNIDIKLLNKQIKNLLSVRFNIQTKISKEEAESIDGIIELLEYISDKIK